MLIKKKEEEGSAHCPERLCCSSYSHPFLGRNTENLTYPPVVGGQGVETHKHWLRYQAASAQPRGFTAVHSWEIGPICWAKAAGLNCLVFHPKTSTENVLMTGHKSLLLLVRAVNRKFSVHIKMPEYKTFPFNHWIWELFLRQEKEGYCVDCEQWVYILNFKTSCWFTSIVK